MKSRNPEVFLLTEIRESNPCEVIQELLLRDTYKFESNRVFEASYSAERTIEQGYTVLCSESEWVDRL